MNPHEVVDRLRDAGRTLVQMPGLGAGPVLPAEDIERMEEVLLDWGRLCRSEDERRLLALFVVGLSWDEVARRTGAPVSRLRRRFGRVVVRIAAVVH